MASATGRVILNCGDLSGEARQEKPGERLVGEGREEGSLHGEKHGVLGGRRDGLCEVP